jgi:hypothetical protein
MIPVVLKLLSKAAKERLRVVEPHVVYMDSDGGVVAECYQVKGYSTAGKPAPFWKTFRVTKVDAVFLLGTTFKAQEPKNLTLRKSRRLIAMAYDRPPAIPAPQNRMQPQPRQQENLLKQTRSWWTQAESAIDGFLSGQDQPPSRH